MISIERCYQIKETCLSEKNGHTLRRIIDNDPQTTEYIQQYLDDLELGNRIAHFATLLFSEVSVANQSEERRQAVFSILKRLDYRQFSRIQMDQLFQVSLMRLVPGSSYSVIETTLKGLVYVLETNIGYTPNVETGRKFAAHIDAIYLNLDDYHQDLFWEKYLDTLLERVARHELVE